LAKSGALYCICQTPYDVPRFMIACDRCDQWFHGECIGISEKEGEFIDLYFCDVCGKGLDHIKRQSRLTSYAEKEDQHRLGQLRIQKQKAQDMVKMIEQKQKFLATVEKRMEQITDDICGFDTRLVWDDLLWQDDVIMDEHSQQQCQIKRKECQRHQQWQNIIQLGLNQERKEQIQVLKMLDKEKQDIKTRMHKRRNEIELANGLKNHTFII
ncbi:uncharacterized protein BX664DRAFT_257778, partial [Halteromyces radiatus]|uniref:uncharacterized protein n=1 Tax=Halteromyces radiatus TaxID=101107 RepID=UPI00221E7538